MSSITIYIVGRT